MKIFYYKNNGEIFGFNIDDNSINPNSNLLNELIVNEDEFYEDRYYFYKVENNKLVYNLEAHKLTALERMRNYIEIKTNKGLESELLPDGKLIGCSEKDLNNFFNYYELAKDNNMDTVYVKLLNGETISLPTSDLGLLINQIRAYGLQLFNEKWNYEEQIKNCADGKCIDNILSLIFDKL